MDQKESERSKSSRKKNNMERSNERRVINYRKNDRMAHIMHRNSELEIVADNSNDIERIIPGITCPTKQPPIRIPKIGSSSFNRSKPKNRF